MKSIKRNILITTIEKENFNNIFEQEILKINNIPKLPKCDFYHIGSTAINNSIGEKVLDILVVVENLHEITSFDEKRLNNIGYHRIAHNNKGIISYIKIQDFSTMDFNVKLFIVQKNTKLYFNFLRFHEMLQENNKVFNLYQQFKKENFEEKYNTKKYNELRDSFINKIMGEHYGETI